MTTTLSYGDMVQFEAECETLQLPVPPPLARAIQLIEAARATERPPADRLLDLSDDQVPDRVFEMAIRRHAGRGAGVLRTDGVVAGIEAFEDQIAAEAREATLPFLEQLVEAMRPQFDAAAEPIVEAVTRYGFTLQTTSDEVIDREDEGASAAWRASRPAFHELAAIADFRRRLSTTFDVSPTPKEFRLATAGDIDYSVCFTAAGMWTTDGKYYVAGEIGGDLDWFALAQGGLRLNTADEVRLKILERRAHTGMF